MRPWKKNKLQEEEFIFNKKIQMLQKLKQQKIKSLLR